MTRGFTYRAIRRLVQDRGDFKCPLNTLLTEIQMVDDTPYHCSPPQSTSELLEYLYDDIYHGLAQALFDDGIAISMYGTPESPMVELRRIP